MNRAGGEAREERPAIYRVTTRRADDGSEETFSFLSKGGVDAHLEFYREHQTCSRTVGSVGILVKAARNVPSPRTRELPRRGGNASSPLR